MKPTLNLYLDWQCTAVVQEEGAEEWQWCILLRPRKGSSDYSTDRQVLIVNKSRRETIAPSEIIGATFRSISMSVRDTTMHFMMPNGHRLDVGLNPTQYAIEDPAYGGAVYPQWPEELEEAGIPSHPDEGVSAAPDDAEAWHDTVKQYAEAADKRHAREANEFLEEERNADAD